MLKDPRHPYTRLLLESVPQLGVPIRADAASSNTELPSNRHLPTGCFFKDRCPLAGQGCEKPQDLKACAGPLRPLSSADGLRI